MHRLEPDKCPTCKNKLNAATSIDGEEAKPEPNDITICVNCAQVLRFDDALKLCIMTVDDFDNLPSDVRENIEKASKAINRTLLN